MAKKCRAQKSKSKGKASWPKKAWVVQGGSHLRPTENHLEKAVSELFLLASTSATITAQTTSKMDDGGPQCATIRIEGVPATELMDTGSNIIISVDLFKRVVANAGLKKKDFKTAYLPVMLLR